MTAGSTVGAICSRRVRTVPRHRRVVEVARAMAGGWVPCVIVIQEGDPVGVVTKRTLVQDVLARGYTGMELTAGDVMRSPLVTVDAGTEVLEAARIMDRTRLRYLAVTEEGRLVGLLSDRHVARHLLSLMSPEAQAPADPDAP